MKPIALTDDEARQLAETGEVDLLRKVKPQPPFGYSCLSDADKVGILVKHCPHGPVGELRWVKERWCPDIVTGYLRPASTMPRRVSKTTVEILRVEAFEREGVWWWRAKARRVEA